MRIIKRPELRALAIAGIAAALGIIALCLLLVVRTNTAQEFRQQTSANCEAINDLKGEIRVTFMVARDRALAQPGLDESTKKAIEKAYQDELTRYQDDACP